MVVSQIENNDPDVVKEYEVLVEKISNYLKMDYVTDYLDYDLIRAEEQRLRTLIDLDIVATVPLRKSILEKEYARTAFMFFQGRLDLTIRGSLPLYFDLVIVRGDKPRMQRMGIFNDFIKYLEEHRPRRK